MCCFFSRSKWYQEDKKRYTWHIYYNHFQPHLCHVLVLTKYLFSNTGLSSNGSIIFPGNSTSCMSCTCINKVFIF